MKLGIVANEFFDRAIGPMGGFGWAARQVATFFNTQPHLGVNVLFLTANRKYCGGQSHRRVHDTVLLIHSQAPRYRRLLLKQQLDLVLTIDYRPQYRAVLEILAHIPVVVWLRDPRPPAALTALHTLTIPEDPAVRPQGIRGIDCTSVSTLLDPHRRPYRPVLFATPAPTLSRFLESTYHVSGVACTFLPNIVTIDVRQVIKNQQPRVIFLGRLDPIKRPWVFVELARRFPEVEFLMLGQSHFQGRGSWVPRQLPENVTLLGHIDGEQKLHLLASAWVLVNTSIHEALPISFLEALACDTPLLSCTNPEGLVSRFGIFTGSWDGDGMESLPRFVNGLRQLLEHHSWRTQLGQEGRAWVERTHNSANFLHAFDVLCASAGVHRLSRTM
jgi:glycosyltransferase involved in cell wall biosynthesis